MPYVQEWGLPLNPEDLQAMAVAVLLHVRNDAEGGRTPAGDVPLDGLTDDALALMEGRAARATPGPWKAFIEGRDHTSGADFVRTGGPDLYLFHENAVAPVEDHDFVAHARQDVPRLVAEVRRLRSTRDVTPGEGAYDPS